MFSAAYWMAASLVKMQIAPLAAWYAVLLGLPTMPYEVSLYITFISRLA